MGPVQLGDFGMERHCRSGAVKRIDPSALVSSHAYTLPGLVYVLTCRCSFNEPDLSSQSNLTAAEAAAGYMQYMQPFAGSIQLGGPAITGSPMGLTWLAQFYGNCTACTIDFQPVHWYDQAWNTGWFQSYLEAAYTTSGNRSIWVTEVSAASLIAIDRDVTDASASSKETAQQLSRSSSSRQSCHGWILRAGSSGTHTLGPLTGL